MQQKKGFGGLLLLIIIIIIIVINWPPPPLPEIVGEWRVLNASGEGEPFPNLVTFSSTGLAYESVGGGASKYIFDRNRSPYLLQIFNNNSNWELRKTAIVTFINSKTMKWGMKLIPLPVNKFGDPPSKYVMPKSFADCNQFVVFEKIK